MAIVRCMDAVNSKDIYESFEADLSDYFALLKPRVMSLVVFTGIAGFVVAPGAFDLHPFLAVIGILMLAINAGAAGAINMWYDRDIDAIMNRTKNRPLPLNKIQPAEALAFGVVLSVFSVMVMALAVNYMAAGILAFANIFYSLVYTVWLKRSTPQNIVIGGAAGAFPPMIGWVMATGTVTIEPVILFLIIFLWTPPHFWALSLFANEDYKRAKIPMMSVTHGAKATKIQMVIYTHILLPVTIFPYFLGFAGLGYGLIAGILSLCFIGTAVRVYASDDLKYARAMFGFSIFYLFALFTALMIF